MQSQGKLARYYAFSVFQPIAPAAAACYNPRNDYDGDDVGRSQLAESRRVVRGGSRARAQSPPESPGTLFNRYSGLRPDATDTTPSEDTTMWEAVPLNP